MLASHRIGRQDPVVEEVRAEQQGRHPDPGVEEHPERGGGADRAGRDHRAGVPGAEHQGVEDDPGPEDDPGLEASARAEVAVELDVEREQQDEGRSSFAATLRTVWCCMGRGPLQSRRAAAPSPGEVRMPIPVTLRTM